MASPCVEHQAKKINSNGEAKQKKINSKDKKLQETYAMELNFFLYMGCAVWAKSGRNPCGCPPKKLNI